MVDFFFAGALRRVERRIRVAMHLNTQMMLKADSRLQAAQGAAS